MTKSNPFHLRQLIWLALAAMMVWLLPAGQIAWSFPSNPLLQEEQEKSEQEKSEQETEEQEGDAEDSEQDEKGQDENGEADLDEAMEMRINAKSTRDLDRVAELCESAIEKGLDESGEAQARQFWVAALMEHAEQLSRRIFATGGQDRRWRFYRREALKRLDKVIELEPKNGEAFLMVARLNSLAGGDRDAARDAIEKAVELAGSDNEQLSRALYSRALLADNDDSILADLDQAIEINPENVEAIRSRGAFYMRTKQPDKALEDFRRFLEVDGSVDAHYMVVDSLQRLEKFDEAIEILDKAISKDPDNAQSYLIRAQINSLRDDNDQAIQDAGKSIGLNPRNLTALLLRAQLYGDKEEFDKALADIENVLEIQPLLVRGIAMRGWIHAAREDYENAIKDYKLLAENSNDVSLQLQLAVIYNANNQPRESIRIYNRILRDDEENADAYRGRGDARLSLGQHKEAVEDYDKALESLPEDDHVLNNLAWVLATSPEDDVRDGKRAVELATKACELTEWKAAHILSTLASGYAEDGDFENAKKYLKQGLEISESDEQRESMQNELDHYLREEPFRELQDIEEERRKAAERKAKREAPNEDPGESGDGDDKSGATDKDKKDDQSDDGDGGN